MNGTVVGPQVSRSLWKHTTSRSVSGHGLTDRALEMKGQCPPFLVLLMTKRADNIELPKVEPENVVLRQESYTFVFSESLIFEKLKIEYK